MTCTLIFFLGCLDEETLDTLFYDSLLSVFKEELQIPMFSQIFKTEDLDSKNVLE